MFLVVEIDADLSRQSPRELRERFIAAIRGAIMAAGISGDIEMQVAEELLRALPALRALPSSAP